MSKPMVLITGGTSRTGSEVAKQLLAKGTFTLRLGARNPSKLTAFVAQGAEAVELNSTFESMKAALKGVNYVYFIYPPLVGGAGDILVSNFIRAVTEPGTTVTHIVYLSTMRAAPNNKEFELVYRHYNNEQQLIRSGIPYTILRPTYFHENMIAYFAESIKKNGEYATSAGDGVWTVVAIYDVAAVAVEVMTHPSEHAGKTYALREEAVTHPQVAEKISKVIGKRVRVVNLTPEEHFGLIMKTYSGPGSAESIADHTVRADTEKREGQFSVVTPDLEMVLGRKGVTLDDFLAEHAADFQEQ